MLIKIVYPIGLYLILFANDNLSKFIDIGRRLALSKLILYDQSSNQRILLQCLT